MEAFNKKSPLKTHRLIFFSLFTTVVNIRKSSMAHNLLHVNGTAVKMVNSVKFLGVHISDDLSWNQNTTTIMKKALS